MLIKRVFYKREQQGLAETKVNIKAFNPSEDLALPQIFRNQASVSHI